MSGAQRRRAMMSARADPDRPVCASPPFAMGGRLVPGAAYTFEHDARSASKPDADLDAAESFAASLPSVS